MRSSLQWLVLTLFAVAWSVAAAASDLQAPVFHFALLGDAPYTDEEEGRFLELLKTLNADQSLTFVVHAGDFKDGHSPCTDELFARRHAQFQSVEHPLIIVFGDNEWVDCRREEAGQYDPAERLNKLREIFTSGSESLGKRTLRLSRQSDDARYRKFRENVRWTYGDVLFVTLNVPGSYNNSAQKRESEERNAANVAWLKESFRLATDSGARGVLVVIHANPKFQSSPKRNPYRVLLATLEREVLACGKPVVLVHGDTHRFRIDKPLRDSKTGQPIDNLTRVETFGSPDVRWIKGTVDPRDPNVFSFEPMQQESR
ncbi:MAG TPA: metallophosphoesterase [Acidobacteriota bacterium]|nr:metallophosphoesterase [Nitrospirales bacterium]